MGAIDRVVVDDSAEIYAPPAVRRRCRRLLTRLASYLCYEAIECVTTREVFSESIHNT